MGPPPEMTGYGGAGGQSMKGLARPDYLRRLDCRMLGGGRLAAKPVASEYSLCLVYGPAPAHIEGR